MAPVEIVAILAGSEVALQRLAGKLPRTWRARTESAVVGGRGVQREWLVARHEDVEDTLAEALTALGTVATRGADPLTITFVLRLPSCSDAFGLEIGPRSYARWRMLVPLFG